MAYVNKNREGREFWNRLCSLPRYMFLLRPSGKGVQKLEDSTGNWIDVHDAQQIVDDAQTELAALREELATAKRNEHNSEVAYKAAIERQNELREELNRTTEKLIQYEQGFWGRMASKNRKEVDGLQQRLTAAEHWSGTLERAIFRALDDSSEDAETGVIEITRADYEALAILIGEPTESGASNVQS